MRRPAFSIYGIYSNQKLLTLPYEARMAKPIIQI